MDENFPKRRRWFQFRLRTLLIAILVLSLPLSWFAVRLERARKQREAVEAIERLGGIVTYGGDGSGRGLVVTVESVYFLQMFEFQPPPAPPNSLALCVTDQICNEDLKTITELKTLEGLVIQSTHVNDDGLEHLKGLTNLNYLDLQSTQITDAGLVHLKGLTNLQSLSLGDTEINDTGLEHLRGLSSLEQLALTDTNVTPEGIKKLQAALPNCKIVY